ncbi:uncharacterized protein RCC_12219 [Ramularia collo-cygni]|uniref:Uncharacterized protein n=1 Tax=Ramularia collo-cygni TaxID=112498 RepID=A0A2D3VE12_9PEZI|nr:uncharacterized protein RCC_12219 [Ramularia collo-cygni]CZT22066.1 uncharacterized protein RCC_12219 [Ramularia collo-cygni]
MLDVVRAISDATIMSFELRSQVVMISYELAVMAEFSRQRLTMSTAPAAWLGDYANQIIERLGKLWKDVAKPQHTVEQCLYARLVAITNAWRYIRRAAAELSGSKKLKHTDVQLASIGKRAPVGREKFNAEHQGFPKGEIEYHRERGARPICWDVRYFPEANSGQIFFAAPHEDTRGGPHAFLSCGRPFSFTVPEWQGTTKFTCIEQVRQFLKARCMSGMESRRSTVVTPALSSDDLACVIHCSDAPAKTLIELGSSFDDLGETDPDWWWELMATWQYAMEKFLPTALRAMYEQDLDSKIRLMMTGNFELYEATTEYGGIGYPAYYAQRNKAEWGKNFVGRFTQQLRDEFRTEEPEWPTGYAFDFFRHAENRFPSRNWTWIQPTAEFETQANTLVGSWLAIGGEPLEKRISIIKRQIGERRMDEKARDEKAEADALEELAGNADTSNE